MRIFVVAVLFGAWTVALRAAETLPHYYAHPAEQDRHGVIAPWYTRQNGQFDYRVRIAAETLKRYAWAVQGAVAPAPEYVYNGTWSIDHEGTIVPIAEEDWANGDLGQRAAYILGSLIEYYRYSGDPAAFTPIYATANYLIDHCQTDPDHGWPGILISVPTMGKRYGKCAIGPGEGLRDRQGMIQLDIVAEVGLELVRAYQMTGEQRWLDAARRWAGLLARNRNRDAGAAPWGRYANKAGGSGMNGVQKGGVVFLLAFFDELIRTGAADAEIVAARDAGRRYLQDVLLPAWILNDTWGRNYWDWENPVQAENITEYVAYYLMDHPAVFPNWRRDVRNILSIFLNHTGVSPRSRSDVFHGAWAYPEASNCCDRSLWYGPMELAGPFARYGVEADSAWAREIARRSQLLATYDPLDNGLTMDLIDGGMYVNRRWFKIAHPMALKHVLKTIAWLPEIMGPNRENHIVRSTGVVKHVVYAKGRVSYLTFDAPAGATEVLRLSFEPEGVQAGGRPLARRSDLAANGYTTRSLPGGDFLVAVRHDGAVSVEVSGPDPQEQADDHQLTYQGAWRTVKDAGDVGGARRVAVQAGASVEWRFTGNQVRLIAPAGPSGGLADVYLDDRKQLAGVDFFSPVARRQQVLYSRGGLHPGPHTLRLVARGSGNPLSNGTEVYVDAIQFSAATGDSGFGEGGGPTDAQRLIFGYSERHDYVDAAGHAWRPGTEFLARTGHLTDAVAKTWWTIPQAVFIGGGEGKAKDPDLYRFGVHHQELRVPLTVGPGGYHVRLKFAETQFDRAGERAFTIWINGLKKVEALDVFATGGGAHMPVDLVFNGIKPRNGVIEIHLAGDEVRGRRSEAILQALELGPGDGGAGDTPKSVALR
jgi:hypothetical protein